MTEDVREAARAVAHSLPPLTPGQRDRLALLLDAEPVEPHRLADAA